MNSKPSIGIAGATGLIGSEVLSLIDEAGVPHGQIRLFATRDSAGEVYRAGSDEVTVEEMTESSFAGIELAIFATPTEIAQQFIPAAVKSGARALDLSPWSRAAGETPLVLADVRFSSEDAAAPVLALPSPAAAQLAPILKVIDDRAGLKRVILSTYQAVSGAGKAALDELWNQTLAIFNQREVKNEEFAHQIAFNCIPQVDVMLDDGTTREERAIELEIKRLLGRESIGVSVTAVRVPVLYSYGQSVNVETERPLAPADLRKALESVPHVSVYFEPDEYPLPLGAAGTDEIHVGRVRRDRTVENGLSLWVVADNVRRGAALTALDAARRWIEISTQS